MRALPRTIVLGVALLAGFSARPARAEDPDTEIARRRFVAGAKLYEDAHYEEAIAEFTAARVVKSAPAFDYNIARCYDRLERTASAIEWYERFLEHAPEGPEQLTARARLKELRARSPVTLPVVVERADAPAWRHRYPVAVPAAVTAVGVASLVAGGALYGVSGSSYDDYTKRGCGTNQACFSDTWGRTRTIERAGIGLLVTGGVLGAASIGLWSAWRAR